MSSAQALIFVAAVIIAVALLVLGVIVASRTSLPLRRDGHTKVYAGDQKRLCDCTRV